MSVKLTIGHVRNEFEKRGWRFITNDYTSSQQRLEVICPNGHTTFVTWNNFKNKKAGDGCKFCSGKVTHSYEFVKSKFEEAGYQFLSNEYTRNDIPLEFICDRGHKENIRFGDFYNSGARCNKCKGIKLSKIFRESEESIINFCKSINCELIKSEVRHGKTYIHYKCVNGHEAKAYFTNFKRHQSCWECSKLKKSKDKCYRWNPDRQYIKTIKKFRKISERLIKRIFQSTDQIKVDKSTKILGYTSLELKNHIENHPNIISLKNKSYHIDHIFPIKSFFDYNIKDIKLINCLDNLQPLSELDNLNKSGNYDVAAFEKWLKVKGVNFESKIVECAKITQEIYSWLIYSGITATLSNGIILVDKLVIKYVGYIVTNNDNKEDYLKYKNSGIRLITIFFDEWAQRKDQCKNFIKSVIGMNKVIYGRECDIRTIAADIGRNFLKVNHIQGSNKLGLVFWGIFHNDELVGVISLGRHNRQNVDDKSIVLDRLCFKDGIQVLGGASKLFNKCIEYARYNKLQKIISFSDNRWSQGKIYEKLNFSLEKEYDADYSYISLNGISPIRLSKQSQRKKIVVCPKNFTEHEWAKKRGLTRIYDCGKKKWVFSISSNGQV